MMRSYLISLVALLCFAIPMHAQGPVVLMGIDAEDGNSSGGNHGGFTPYEDVLSNGVLPSISNGGSGLLVIGGGKLSTDDVTQFWTAVAAGVGEPVTFVNGATAISSQAFGSFKVICISSSVFETLRGGLTNDENDALSLRASDVADHVNGGGGLFGLSSDGLTTPYGYLGTVGAFSFGFPNLFDRVTATTEGMAVGISDSNLDVCCWHDEYLSFPGFLDVLATNDFTGNACAIGGFNVVIVQGITLTPLISDCAVGLDSTITATVADSAGDPIVGTLVTFTITSGPNLGTIGMDMTDAAGQAFFTYSSSSSGTDLVQGCFVDSAMVMQCDTVTKNWIANDCFVLDFETEDDFSSALVNGQHINTEFGDIVTISATGSNAGAGIFDSTPTGPNGASRDPDLLVDSGNILILQIENVPVNSSDIFPVPNDDFEGGTLGFSFITPVMPMAVTLIDIDSGDGAVTIVMSDSAGAKRTYSVPADWTGDVTAGEPGQGVLDLTLLTMQAGFKGSATAVQDMGYDAQDVVQIDFNLNGSGGLDDLSCCFPSTSSFVRAMGLGNPAGSLTAISGLPGIGETLVLGLDDPTGNLSSGARPLLMLSPSLGARGGSALGPRFQGRFLLNPQGAFVLAGPQLWNGQPVPIVLNIPNDINLLGLTMYAQGALLAPGRGGSGLSSQVRSSNRHFLTEAVQLVIGR